MGEGLMSSGTSRNITAYNEYDSYADIIKVMEATMNITIINKRVKNIESPLGL